MFEVLVQPFRNHFCHPLEKKEEKVSVASSVTGMPGVSNLLLFPFEAVHTVNTIRKAHRIRDLETTLDATIKIVSVPFMIGNGLGVSADTMAEIHLIQPHTIAAVSLAGTIAGIILCSLEFIIEGLSFLQISWFEGYLNESLLKESCTMLDKSAEKQEAFLQKILRNLSQNKGAYSEIFGEEAYQSFMQNVQKKIEMSHTKPDKTAIISECQMLLMGLTLSYIQSKYLQLLPEEIEEIKSEVDRENQSASPEKRAEIVREKITDLIDGRKSMLSRRITPWLQKELDSEIIPLLKDITSKSRWRIERGLAKAEECIKKIQMQIEKKKLVHGLGIACLVFLIAALAVGVHMTPLCISLYIIGFSLAISRFIAYKGLLKSKTWEIEWNKVPPKWSITLWNYFSKKPVLTEQNLPERFNAGKRATRYLDHHTDWKKLDRRIQPYV